MQQPMLDDQWEYRPMVGKLYLKQNDSIQLPKRVLESLIIWVEPDEVEDERRDTERERVTLLKAQAIMKEHEHDTWCTTLGVWLKKTPSTGLANAAYRHVYGMYLPIEQKQWAEDAVKDYGLENWALALLHWRGNTYNPQNIHGMIARAKHNYKLYNRGELPVLQDVDPIFLEEDTHD
jgi:hypothetical protein